jgi:hypothetical protein
MLVLFFVEISLSVGIRCGAPPGGDVQVLGVEDVNQLPSRQAGAGFNTA